MKAVEWNWRQIAKDAKSADVSICFEEDAPPMHELRLIARRHGLNVYLDDELGEVFATTD